MLANHQHSPLNNLIQTPKTTRRPLQPKKTPSSAVITPNTNPSHSKWIDISHIDSANKENPPQIHSNPLKKIESFHIIESSFDSSLAEELSAIREKLERVRIDKERTENMLMERSLILDLQMQDIESRGEVQKQLEIEVDRLYRLQEIRLACMRVSPVRSLRDKEQEKKTKRDQLKASNNERGDTREQEVESPQQSSTSEV